MQSGMGRGAGLLIVAWADISYRRKIAIEMASERRLSRRRHGARIRETPSDATPIMAKAPSRRLRHHPRHRRMLEVSATRSASHLAEAQQAASRLAISPQAIIIAKRRPSGDWRR